MFVVLTSESLIITEDFYKWFFTQKHKPLDVIFSSKLDRLESLVMNYKIYVIVNVLLYN